MNSINSDNPVDEVKNQWDEAKSYLLTAESLIEHLRGENGSIDSSLDGRWRNIVSRTEELENKDIHVTLEFLGAEWREIEEIIAILIGSDLVARKAYQELERLKNNHKPWLENRIKELERYERIAGSISEKSEEELRKIDNWIESSYREVESIRTDSVSADVDGLEDFLSDMHESIQSFLSTGEVPNPEIREEMKRLVHDQIQEIHERGLDEREDGQDTAYERF